MGWARNLRAALTAGAVLLAGAAGAHEFECEKKVNGASMVTLTSYPATVTWSLKITNTHPDHASTAQSLEDALLESLGFTFNPDAPLTLQVGEDQGWTFVQTISSQSACEAIAATDGLVDANIDNVFKVSWDVGQDQCMARVVCSSPPPPPPPPPPGGGVATRTMGFFKTHLDPLQACLDVGAIDLGPGFALIDTLPEALGVLWGHPNRFADGTRRDELEKARFLLARQTLVGVCNVRLFNTVPDPDTLISDALAALQGNVCSEILDLAEQVDAYNNSGTEEDLPAGFDKGPTTPQLARQTAADPSIDTSATCATE